MILLTPDQCTLWDVAGVPDEHGWVQEQVPVQVWSGLGNVQEAPPDHSPDATDGGGDGPVAPHHARTGTAHLPPDCGAAPGMLLTCRGIEWRVERVQAYVDPVGGPLGSLLAQVRERDDRVAGVVPGG